MALNNAQYHTIQRMYEKKQLHNRNILDKRQQEVYAKLPEYKQILSSISELSVQQARKLLEGNEGALTELKEKIALLSKKAKDTLVSGGFPENYLEPVYECNNCKDTGYVGNEKCHCFQKAVVDLLYTQSNLQDRLQKENFDTFSFTYYSANYTDPKTGTSSLDSIKKAHAAAKEFVETFGKDFRNLFLYGDTGVGKTFLSNCIAKELMDQSYSVIYLSTFKLFDILAKSKFDKDEAADQMNHHIFDCDLLIIDDLGTELVNAFTVSQLFLCINERILRKKSTIISTNLSMADLRDIYSERIFSRVTSNYTMLRLIGDDIRIKKKLMN